MDQMTMAQLSAVADYVKQFAIKPMSINGKFYYAVGRPFPKSPFRRRLMVWKWERRLGKQRS